MITNKLFAIVFICCFGSFILAAADWKDNLFTERSVSFGLMSERLGTDFWNFSWTAYKKNNNDVFISIGPSIFIPTNVGMGWKHYFKARGKKNKVVLFSCLSMFERSANKMSNSTGDAIREDSCVGLSGGISYFLSKCKKRNVYLNVGVFASYDFRNDYFVLPVVNIEFKR
ncbi:MAG: hypothetical protein CMG00_01300 [Candidatus Marinimicrobia bacterium]|nr:hypothetical protein [Candidatus Neomarinimicrobiota bacterium]|tara:strand:- start:2997 stop:3509 length:513 start_codon:yes stop_codon:yes gene_type:complete